MKKKVKPYELSGPLLPELILVSVHKATRSIATPSPSQVPPAFHQVTLTVCWYLFILLGGERHYESKVSCTRAQHNDPARA